jgi:lipopolysaccharide heptosyltransferase II
MKILLIRLRLIGDVVFTTPAIRALRRRFPDARLSYLVEPEAAPVVRGNPHLDDVIVAPRPAGLKRLGFDLALARRLRAARFDLVIDFHGGPRSSWLAWASGAPKRVGYVVRGRSWMYTDRVARPRELRARHSVENQWDLVAALGLDPPDRARDPVEMPEDPEAARSIARQLGAAGVGDLSEAIVLHVSAGNPFRRWPADAFVELIVELARADPGRRIVVTSGPSDAAAATAIQEAARLRLGTQGSQVVSGCGEFTLPELRALIAHAALFIGGDSGPLHVAATTRVPVVGLYGPTLPARSAPWRDPASPSEAADVEGLSCRPCDQRRCEPGDFRCLRWLTPQQVAARAERALGRRCP